MGFLSLYVVLYLAAVYLLNQPSIQARLTPVAEDLISQALETSVQVRRIHLEPFDVIALEDVRIHDQQGEPLLFADELHIGTFSLSLIQWLAGPAQPKTIGARRLALERPFINLYRSRRDSSFNVSFLLESESPKPKQEPPTLDILLPELEIIDLSFRLVDSLAAPKELAPTPGHLNYQNLDLAHLNLRAGFELQNSRRVEAAIRSFSTREELSGIHLKSFRTNFRARLEPPENAAKASARKQSVPALLTRIEPESEMVFEKSYIHLASSKLDFDLRMPGETLASIGESGRNRNVHATLRESTLHFPDMGIFLQDSFPLTGTAKIQGKLNGDYRELRTPELRFEYEENTSVKLSGLVRNYADSDSLFLKTDVNRGSRLDFTELNAFLWQEELPAEVLRLKRMRFNGHFEGPISDLRTKGDFHFPMGFARADIHWHFPVDNQPLSYRGNLYLGNFNVDQVMGADVSKRLNVKADFNGHGDSFEEIVGDFRFQLLDSQFQSYQLDSSGGSLALDKGNLRGQLEVRDDHGGFDGWVAVDVRDSVPSYQAFGDFKQLDLQHYQISQDSLTFSGIVNARFEGDSLDDWAGSVRMFRIRMRDYAAQKLLRVRNVQLDVSKRSGLEKHLELDSDLAKLQLDGRFRYRDILPKAASVLNEAQLFFQNNRSEIKRYYSKKEPDSARLDLNYDLEAADLNRLLKFMSVEAYVSAGSRLRGKLATDGTEEELIASFSFDSVAFEGIAARALDGNLNIGKPTMSNAVSGRSLIDSRRLHLSEEYHFKNPHLLFKSKENHLNYVFRSTQAGPDKDFNLAGDVFFGETFIQHRFNSEESFLEIGNDRWRFSPDNFVELGETSIRFSDFRLGAGRQQLHLTSGAADQQDRVNIHIDSLQLASLNQFIPSDIPIDGLTNGKLELRRIFDSPIFVLNGQTEALSYGEVKVGDVMLRSSWTDSTQTLHSNAKLIHEKDTLVRANGHFRPNAGDEALQFEILTSQLRLDLAKPFYEDELYDVKGSFTARMFINGSLENPRLTGRGKMMNAVLGVSYFRQKFYLNDVVTFQKDALVFNNFQIFDSPTRANGNGPSPRGKALLNGRVIHNGFSEVRLDLNFSVEQGGHFQVMNTQPPDNETFYGRAVVSKASGKVSGTPEDLVIKGDITSGPDTELSIPISDFGQEQHLSYVHFKGAEKHEAGSIQKQTELEGFTFNMNIEATEQAQINIIVDAQAGDRIQARGVGNLTLAVTPDGELRMTGTYEIIDGEYLFTFRNIINKEFLIDRGSTISWDGDPYTAQIRMTAIYERDVSLSTLDTTLSGIRPVQVLMEMTNTLDQPDIEFSIKIPNLNRDQAFRIVSRLNMIRNDQQELNRQVFSLLLLGQFAPTGTFFGQGGASTGVTTSVSEFLSNQVNNLIGQSLRTDDVNVKFQTAEDVVRVALRLSLLEDRLTIERNGAIVNNQNEDLSLGNISIQFRILPPPDSNKPQAGVLAVEIFNRENLISNTVVSSNRGVGIFYRKEFDRLINLLKPKKRKKPQQPEN